MWKLDLLDRIISVTVMEVSSPTRTDRTKEALPPFLHLQKEQIET